MDSCREQQTDKLMAAPPPCTRHRQDLLALNQDLLALNQDALNQDLLALNTLTTATSFNTEHWDK